MIDLYDKSFLCLDVDHFNHLYKIYFLKSINHYNFNSFKNLEFHFSFIGFLFLLCKVYHNLNLNFIYIIILIILHLNHFFIFHYYSQYYHILIFYFFFLLTFSIFFYLHFTIIVHYLILNLLIHIYYFH